MIRRIVLALAVLAIGIGTQSGCKCPPGLAENAANVAAIADENDAVRATATTPDSVKAAQALRNREARALAAKLVEACK